MAVYNGYSDTLHTRLTQLLMDNGASVSKQSVDSLIVFITTRDQETIKRITQDAERTLRQLQADTKLKATSEAQS